MKVALHLSKALDKAFMVVCSDRILHLSNSGRYITQVYVSAITCFVPAIAKFFVVRIC